MASELSSTAAQIVASARSLLATRGYNGFSYADIAEAVGISKPSIHHHFPSKAALVRRVVADYRAEAQAGMKACASRWPTRSRACRPGRTSGRPACATARCRSASAPCSPPRCPPFP
jgi:AcrR family transcriptional regulator